VRRLLSELVAPKIDALARGARDDFRKACCYREEVDRVLRRHEESLRVMFERYSDGTPPGDTMCFDEWKEFCVDLGFVDAGFTLRDATSCFVRSRMQAVDECSEEGWSRITNLSFEDFLEAFVRTACMKALPTDAEIDQAGLSDAGQFLLHMQLKRPDDYQDFLRNRAINPLHPGAAQPVARCVEHLCMLMVRIVERATQAEGDAKISRAEASKFDLKGGNTPTKTSDRDKYLASPRKSPQK
tara:strand:+ start:92 stop:817 length:726 start_codon:yes stop_codon:yes gene_type:complete